MREKYTEPETFELVRACFNRNWGNNLIMTPFIKTQSWDSRFKHMSNLFTATVTYGTFSFDLETRHFNIDILAEDIHNRLLEENLPYYEHRISDYNDLTEQYWQEHFYILGYALDRRSTFYNPVLNEYKTYYILRNDGYSTKNPITIHYIHKGNMNEYKQGDFLKYILPYCASDLYEISHDNKLMQKIKRQLIKYFGNEYSQYDNKNKTYYSISKQLYQVHNIIRNEEIIYEYKGDIITIDNINVIDVLKHTRPDLVI